MGPPRSGRTAEGQVNVESTGAFEAMDDAQLMAAWHEICPKQPFPGRAVAIPRMLAVLASKTNRALNTKPKRPKMDRGRPHVRFNLPAKEGPKRLPRPETRRDKTLILCTKGKGAKIEEIMGVTGADVKQAYNDVRLLHSDMGYGIVEDADGWIKVFE